ncbi:MAG: general secretion pathway protein GspB, partial [Methylobacter sp.]|nr:general secretion pathway protein GspB [Methylobacter sp.]
MSFILNALRKSEQERQALQPETVNDRIFLPHPQQNRSKTAKFIAFLVVSNVLIIACIVWFVLNNSTPKPVIKAQTISDPLPAQDTRGESKPIAESTQPERPVQKEKSETTSIAEWVDVQKPEPAPLPVKPVITTKPAVDTIKPPAIANKAGQPTQTTPAKAVAVKVEPDQPETIPVKNDIPFLGDLPFEFRQSVPKFTINVFVYSQQPEERIVMIDMVKYKPGQQIKDAMTLKEILPDSL